jgi:hypothetical protein
MNLFTDETRYRRIDNNKNNNYVVGFIDNVANV